tara:strand:+ start:3855 stop:4331 length:477 start_codon:yes stop_codon:yes gene_type:complete
MTTTHALFLIDSLGKVLITHPTNHPTDLWSVPKGLPDEGETSLETAFRETVEETTLQIHRYFNPSKDNITLYVDLGIELYPSKRKMVHAHLIVVNEPWSETMTELWCPSMFEYEGRVREWLPENDIVQWSDIEFAENNLHNSQQIYLKKVKTYLSLLK